MLDEWDTSHLSDEKVHRDIYFEVCRGLFVLEMIMS